MLSITNANMFDLDMPVRSVTLSISHGGSIPRHIHTAGAPAACPIASDQLAIMASRHAAAARPRSFAVAYTNTCAGSASLLCNANYACQLFTTSSIKQRIQQSSTAPSLHFTRPSTVHPICLCQLW